MIDRRSSANMGSTAVSFAGSPRDWIEYTVTAGIFKPKIPAETHKINILHLIDEWEANPSGVSQAIGICGYDDS